MNMPDPRSKLITVAKWTILFLFGWFLLHPIAGIYEKSDVRDIVYMVVFIGGVMGLDIPIIMARKAAWRKDVAEALNTPVPPPTTDGTTLTGELGSPVG